MGSVGIEPFGYGSLGGLSLLVIAIFLLATEFQFLRNVIYTCVFIYLVYFFFKANSLVWSLVLYPEPVPWSKLRPLGGALIGLWLSTWLLWRRGHGVWQHIVICGWFYLMLASIYTSVKRCFSLQGFFHWVQVVEFLLTSLLMLAVPLGMLVVLRRLGYRLPSFKVENHDNAPGSD